MQNVRRLYETFQPKHYDIVFDLSDFKNGHRFAFNVTVRGEKNGNEPLRLHAKDLTIENIEIDGIDVANFKQEDDELLIMTDKSGEISVHLVGRGVATDAMHGIYPCYFEHDGLKKELIATQFESHHAREAFPCIDEPEAKATFAVSIKSSEYVVLSNMPATRSKNAVTVFQTTPRMSPYLLAFVAGELHCKSGKTDGGVEVNIWATPAQSPDSLDFALDIAARSIDFYDNYFGVKYPLPKSDHVALPDFSSGAMENWGLVTYREVALLAEPKTTSISAKRYVATVIAHELSHQWFGNLVTMKWWNNLWLNESFATLMEYICVDALEPQWNIWLDFATSEVPLALNRDALDGVQAVQVDVHHPDEITSIFDGAIVYAKGARLLVMLREFVGERAFREGLTDYFERHAYHNTEANDLWQALSKASGKDVKQFMNSWIRVSGFPVLMASETELRQEQFFIGPHTPSDKVWPIPLGDGSDKLFETKNLAVSTKPGTRFNQNDAGHFVTQYEPKLRAAILDDLDILPTLARLQLLSEQALLARGERMSSTDFLPLLEAYKNETAEPAWDVMARLFGSLKKFVELDSRPERALKDFGLRLAQHQYERLGFLEKPHESEDDTKLRPTILSMMMYGEDESVLRETKRIYESTALEDLKPETRGLVIGEYVYRFADDATFQKLIDTYRTTSNGDLRSDISGGLTSTRDVSRIEALLSLISDPATVRPQDVFYWYVYLLSNRVARPAAWQWIRDNWSWVEKTFAGDKSYDYFPRYAGSRLLSEKELVEYKEFFLPKRDDPGLTRTIDMGITEIESTVALMKRDKQAVEKALLEL